MDITCEHCHSKLKIPADKLPTGQTAKLTCPKCKNKIIVNPAPDKSSEAMPSSSSNASATEVSSNEYNVDDKPFDFLEKGVQTALVCEDDATASNKIISTLKRLKYHMTEVTSQRDALTKIRLHVYDLIVLNESFENSNPESNHVLRYLNSLTMATRRNIFVVLVGNNFRTTDETTAFANSVNMVINPKDLNQLEIILKKSLVDHQDFYGVFKTALKSVGRA
ncbi:MAG: zinc-ribbon domain-containing protein [Deltaproteobacteria bacterium]|nr:zinc-ribbon domain-containing protein [Deltaproteobacteria bacterium]